MQDLLNYIPPTFRRYILGEQKIQYGDCARYFDVITATTVVSV